MPTAEVRDDSFYFETNPPNQAPIVEIFHKGQPVDYRQLNGKTLQQVVGVGYDIHIFGEPVSLREARRQPKGSSLMYESMLKGVIASSSGAERAIVAIKNLTDLSISNIKGLGL